MQRPELGALPGLRPVGGTRCLDGALAIDHNQGVDRAIEPRDAFQMRFGRLNRAQRAVSYGAREPRGGLETRIHACLPCSASRLAASATDGYRARVNVGVG